MYHLAGTDFSEFLRSDNFIAALAISMGFLMALVGIITTTVGGIMKSRAREQSRREIAAYVAEGTIDADKAVELLNAGSLSAIGKHMGALGITKEACSKC